MHGAVSTRVETAPTLGRMFRAAIFALLISASAAPAQPVDVDVELFLAVDVSRSMTPRELEIQRRGYAAALISPDVIAAIRSGPLGRIALTYVEWAGNRSHRPIVPWTVVESEQDAINIADSLTAIFNSNLRRTSISGVIDFATASFPRNGFRSYRQVIDISGDGPNNQGRPVEAARDDALAQGIVINGLPLMTREGMGWQWHLDDLDEYYRHCVIGGPAAFVVPVLQWDHFPTAVRQKLILELVGNTPRVQPAQLQRQIDPGYDCLIGEKIWEDLFEDNF